MSGNIVTVTIGVYSAPVVTPPSSSPTYCVIGVPTALPVQATDPDNLPLTLQIVEPAAVGTLSVNGLSFIYTPQYGDLPDFFKFDVTNGYLTSGPYVYQVQSEPLQAPTAQPQTITTDADTPTNIQLTGIDLNGSSLSYNLSPPVTMVSPGVYQFLYGTLVGSGSSYTYYPTYGFTGIASFEFSVKDALGLPSNASAEVQITVAPKPTATPQTVFVTPSYGYFSFPPEITLAGNDSQGNPLTYSLVSNSTLEGGFVGPDPSASNGSVVDYDPPGSDSYPPGPPFLGVDTFSFVVSDGIGYSDPVAVTIVVDSPPVAYNQSLEFQYDVTQPIQLTGDDPDDDANPGVQPLSYYLTSLPQHGGTVGDGSQPGLHTRCRLCRNG